MQKDLYSKHKIKEPQLKTCFDSLKTRKEQKIKALEVSTLEPDHVGRKQLLQQKKQQQNKEQQQQQQLKNRMAWSIERLLHIIIFRQSNKPFLFPPSQFIHLFF